MLAGVALVLAATITGPDAGAGAAPGGATASEHAQVRGRVVTPGGDSVVPVPGAPVTLHRVGSDHAGPLDSTHTDAAGRYVFRYRRSGVSDAVYFVSSSHDGIAYFSLPLRPGTDSASDGVITVFDTTSRAIPISVRGRHLVVERPGADATRRVTEVYDLSNDTSVTRVAASDAPAAAVWTAVLPTGARSPSVRESDVPAGAVRFADGRVLVYAPFAPGIRQLAYTYTLAPGDFPLQLPVQRPTQVLEILLEEPQARAVAPHLHAVRPAPLSGREFQRYLATDVPASGVIRITVPATPRDTAPWLAATLTLVIGGAMTWALARALRRR